MSTMGKEGALRFLLLHTRYQNSAALKIRLLRYEFCRLEKSQHWVTLFSGRDLRAETRVLARAVSKVCPEEAQNLPCVKEY